MGFLRPDARISALPVDAERKPALLAFEKGADVRFRRLDLLNLAFCHRSYAHEHPGHAVNNERLEFLGDSVLGLVVANHLFKSFPELSEGDLAKIKSYVVSEESLAEIAKSLGIPQCLLIGKGEEVSGGRQKKALLADAFEAVVGALYLDAGMPETERFILAWMVPEIEKARSGQHRRDYKTLLQEKSQKILKTYPRYVVVERSGPDHAKVFGVEVLVGESRFGPAEGHSKKEAEQKVAQLAYDKLFGSA